MGIKKIFPALLFLAILMGGCKRSVSPTKSPEATEQQQLQQGSLRSDTLPKLPPGNLNFIVVNDMGRREESEQQTIADLLGRQAAESRFDFIAVAGDPIHDDGVTSVTDEEWNLKFERIYTAESLQKLPYYVVSGNHEYRGNVQAILDYSKVSERWNAPARYYTLERLIGKSEQKALFVFIDTSPLIDKYRESGEYSDAEEQNMELQLLWLDSVLTASNERWTFVIGHHPIYAYTEKVESERTDLQTRVGTIIEKHAVDFYICGHIHNFQYIKPFGCKVNYIVNSSASLSRDVNPIDGTIFYNPDPGYTTFTVSADSAQFYFINHSGTIVYNHTIKK